MKKYLLRFMAIVLALSLTAFAYNSKPSNDLYYWYEQDGHAYVGSSSSASENPMGCHAPGENCIKGYLRSTQPPAEPSVTPDAKYGLHEDKIGSCNRPRPF